MLFSCCSYFVAPWIGTLAIRTLQYNVVGSSSPPQKEKTKTYRHHQHREDQLC